MLQSPRIPDSVKGILTVGDLDIVISIQIENINARVHQDFIGLECHDSFFREVFREKINFSSFFGRKKPF
ncbi:MAG: hypothetical protein ACKO8H_21425 [Microcystis panniformis]